MVKLHNSNIRGKIWKITDDYQFITENAVIVNHTKSRWFLVQKGVQQGGVLSTFLYLVFINELLNELQYLNTNYSVVFDNIYNSPAIARQHGLHHSFSFCYPMDDEHCLQILLQMAFSNTK
jgi:hypothetical protein